MNREAEAKSSSGKLPRRLIQLIVLLAVIGGGLYVWKQYLEDRIIPKRWGVVEDGLIYRSGQLSASLVKKMLEQNEIEVVIDLTKGAPASTDTTAEKEAIESLGIESHRYSLKGNGTGDLGEYTRAVSTLYHAAEANKKVLVHCAAGAQRTGGTVALYRLLVQEEEPRKIVEEMENYDWDREEDAILLEFLNENMAEICQRLVDLRVIEKVPAPLPVLSP